MTSIGRPTDAELAILDVLWDRGPSTVRRVHEALAARRTGYTTILKLMQIMATKGLLERDESQRSHVYSARLGRGTLQRNLVGDLVDRAFRGSTTQLVVQALSNRMTSPRELAQIRKLLDDLESDPRAAG